METILAVYWKISSRAAITGSSCRRFHRVTPWATEEGTQRAETPACRRTSAAYAASFYELVALRQMAGQRVDGAQVLAALNSVINAFNDLLATKCGG